MKRMLEQDMKGAQKMLQDWKNII